MKKFLPFLAITFLLFSCNRKDEIFYPKYEESFYKVLNDDDIYKKIFDSRNRVEIILDFKNEAILNLQKYGSFKTIQKDMYHPCNMTLKINDEEFSYPEVGARMKGNTSRNYHFIADNGKFYKNGEMVNLKLSFSETFDDEDDNDYYTHSWIDKTDRKERKNRRLGGQKKLDLKRNKNYDYTFTRNAYANYCFESEGIPCQKDNIVKLTLKSEKDSVSYLVDMLEAIDGTFVRNHITEGAQDGNLYKCLYQGDGAADFSLKSLYSIGIETPDHTPIYDLKTNDDEPDNSILENLIDVDEFLKFSAMCWVIGNPDDMRNNYNNFYIYFRSDNNKAIFIPYDFDRAFGILKDWPVHTEKIHYNATYQDLNGSKPQISNPLFYRTFLESSIGKYKKYEVNKEFMNRYNTYCYEYANKYLNVDKFKEFTNNFQFCEKDINHDEVGNLTFTEYVSKKLNVMPKLENLIKYAK